MVILTIKYMTPEPIGTIMGKCRGSPTYINSPEDLAKKIILSILNNSSFSLAKLLITGKQFQLALTFPMQIGSFITSTWLVIMIIPMFLILLICDLIMEIGRASCRERV